MGWQDAPVLERPTSSARSAPAWALAPVVEDPGARPAPSLWERVKALPGQVKEAVTGEQRSTAETRALPDWTDMPELNDWMSTAGWKTGLGTLMSNPAESVQIIQANYPGVEARQDDRGNFFMRSSVNGREYAIKPGFQLGDIPRAGAAVATFTPAGKAATLPGLALKAGATQTGIEATQAATGGEFNPGDVAMAAALAPVVPAATAAVRAAARPAAELLARVRGAPAPAAAIREAAEAVPTARQTPAVAEPATSIPPAPTPQTTAAAPSQQAPVAAMPAAELAQTARAAAEGGMGSKNATAQLAEQAAPDAKTLEAAQRLGIQDYLQPDHVTTNQAFRELSQAVKSIPGSQARAAELEGLERVGQRAERLISDLGGSTDASMIDATVKKSLQATQAELEARASKLYDELRTSIPATAEAPATNVLEFIEQRAKDLGGRENLSSMERRILTRLGPKTKTTTETVPGDPLMPGNMTSTTRRIATARLPTYTLLDDVRKDLGAAARQAGPFKDADTGLAKKLYGLLSDDQAAVVERFGMAETYNAARQAVAVRKGIEDDLVSLFGKQIDSSMIGDLSGAMRALPKGDATKLVNLLQAVPPGLRQQVTASGLDSAFRTAGTRAPISFGQYEKWYAGVLRNKQAHAVLMSNLPPAARKQLSDLYRVSRGISAASRERITTGRIQAVQEQFKAADSLAGRLYDAAKRGATGAAVGTAVTPVLGPGVGAAIASALTRGARPAADKAVDGLIASPEFLAAVRAVGTPSERAAVQALARHKDFARFMKAIGAPVDLSSRERWVLQAMEGANASEQQAH